MEPREPALPWGGLHPTITVDTRDRLRDLPERAGMLAYVIDEGCFYIPPWRDPWVEVAPPTSRALLDIIDRLTNDYPVTWSHEGLDDQCFFCGHDAPSYGEPARHEDDCVWVEARTLLGRDPHEFDNTR